MPKSKLSALISLVLVFLSGVLVGVVVHRLYTVNTVTGSASVAAPAKKRDPEELRKHYVAEMRAKVKLDQEQLAQLERILDETREEFHQIHDHMNSEGRAIQTKQTEKINAILRPDQRPLYQEFRNQREAERKRRQAEKKQ